MLHSSLLKREIYPVLENFFIPLGWKYKKMPHSFNYRNDKWVFDLHWSFTAPFVNTYWILHKEIDNLKRDLQLDAPGQHPQTYSVEGVDKYILMDKRCPYSYAPNAPNTIKYGSDKYNELMKSRYGQPLNTLEDIDKWANSVYEYLSGTGMDFIESNKYLPNFLRLIDEEFAESGILGNSLLAGGFQRVTDVMLVAQLCGDIYIEKK